MTDLPHACDRMVHAVGEPGIPLVYYDVMREYALTYTDGGTSHLLITHCPFCGTALPRDLRTEWLALVRSHDLDPWDDADRLPGPLRSDQWWRDAGL